MGCGRLTMTIDNEQAKKLLTQAEYRLYAESRNPVIQDLNPEKLLKRISDARKLFKLWDGRRQSEKQRAENSSTKSARHRATTGHIAASEKAQLFKEVVERFESRLAQTGGARKRPTTRNQPGNEPGNDDTGDRVWV